MAETVAQYNAFLQSESATTTASFLPPDDVTWLASSHPALAQAVGGVPRLHSIGRFLQSKIQDPNFQKTALNIFGAVLGTAFPQLSPFLPLINDFVSQIHPKGLGATTGPTSPGAGAGTTAPLNLPVNANGELVVRLIDDRGSAATAGPTQTPSPGKTGAPVTPPGNLADLIKALKGTLVGTDAATGITTAKAHDGTEVKFDKDGKPLP